ncbi:MAG: ribonuclease P protein component [Alphaproteobacteria bacterium HGW-Alphaproteobacteria-8]|nr:MAG: ribonuclease P protein component [Alphaproteobacteria bacterium HGW-Alphaproteobacteria-8]
MTGAAEAGSEAVNPPRIETLKRRREFLAAARALRAAAPSLILQGRRRGAQEPDGGLIRIGYTCSKKVGDSPTRNRAKRRLRAAAARVLPLLGRGGWDYVLIGRSEATNARVFADLVADMEGALARVHRTTHRAPERDASR